MRRDLGRLGFPGRARCASQPAKGRHNAETAGHDPLEAYATLVASWCELAGWAAACRVAREWGHEPARQHRPDMSDRFYREPGGDWCCDMGQAPANVPLLLYCPERAVSNRERIEVGYASGGQRVGSTYSVFYHSWAVAWMPLDGLMASARAALGEQP